MKGCLLSWPFQQNFKVVRALEQGMVRVLEEMDWWGNFLLVYSVVHRRVGGEGDPPGSDFLGETGLFLNVFLT